MRILKNHRGFTTIELVVGLTVTGLIVAALSLFTTQIFSTSRLQFEQAQITDQARRSSVRMAALLRDAVNVDWNGNGMIDSSSRQEQWFERATANELIFYSNRDVGGTERLEKLRIALQDTRLTLTVSAVTEGGCFAEESTSTIASGVRNVANGVPVFRYYDGDIPISDTETYARRVNRVVVTLHIDNNLQTEPEEVALVTEIAPRRGAYWFTLTGTLSACSDCVDNDLDGTVDTGDVPSTVADPGCDSPEDTSEKSRSLVCDDNFDNDRDGLIDYPADTDCSGPAGTTEGADFDCSDGEDNDGDGAIDYPNDFGCSNANDGNEALPRAACQDGKDNDNDGLTDYPADPDCDSLQDDSEGSISSCANGLDDDGDGAIDQADYSCIESGNTSESEPQADCQDGVDNDGDGFVDFSDDSGCSSLQDSSEFLGTQCDNGQDDDGDGAIDLEDYSCSSITDNTEASPLAACQDGIDNDGDGTFDAGDDPGCRDEQDNNERGLNICDNGQDDDGDGAVDYPADSGCESPSDPNEEDQNCEELTIEIDGGTQTERLDATDCLSPYIPSGYSDRWTFGGTAGQQIQIYMDSYVEYQPYLLLEDPNGVLVSESSDCTWSFGYVACLPEGANFGETYTLPESGTYTIIATSTVSQAEFVYDIWVNEVFWSGMF